MKEKRKGRERENCKSEGWKGKEVSMKEKTNLKM